MKELIKFLKKSVAAKVITTIITALLIFLGTMAWKGINADTTQQVAENTSRIERLEKKDAKFAKDIQEINKKIDKKFDDIKDKMSTIASDVSYLRGKNESK